MAGGSFLGPLPDTHPYADPLSPPLEAVHPRTLQGMSPQEYMRTRGAGEEGFFLPGSDMLWIRTAPDVKESVPMSYLDPESSYG